MTAMKTLIALLLLTALSAGAQSAGLNSKASSAEPKAPKFKWVTLTTGTAVAASTTNLQFTTATFYGVKAAANNAAPTANTGTAYIGYKDVTGEVVTANQPALVDSIAAGSWLALNNIGTRYNLTDFYFLGSTGDKVLIVYEQ